ncbi:MAG TPA: MATE family efflux transporter, partial [Myxococcota bacterium]|nr:MATE family efflux transporter [Myxococcota bacterium]
MAWPIALTMLGETAMGLVDTKLVSGLGAEALGGVGVANSLLYLSVISMLGLMRGVKICAAHTMGDGRPQDGLRYAQVGLLTGFSLGLLIAWAFQHGETFFHLLGASNELVSPAQLYLAARGFGVPAACAYFALMEYRQGLGDVRLPMLIGVAGNLLNAVLAYALIYGHAGLPALGVAGAGYGTAICEVLQLCAMGAVMLRNPQRESPTLTLRQ